MHRRKHCAEQDLAHCEKCLMVGCTNHGDQGVNQGRALLTKPFNGSPIVTGRRRMQPGHVAVVTGG